MTGRPAPARFDEPWHAQLFAVTVAMNEAGHFTWGEWTDAFAATLARHGASRELNGGDDYFAAWLETLERLLSEHGSADEDELRALRDAWESAYLRTPHGAPVRLAP